MDPNDKTTEVETGKTEENKLQVEVVDTRSEVDKTKTPINNDKVGADKPEDEELAAVSDSVKRRIAELKFQAHDQRRKREAAEQSRDEAIRFAQAQRQQMTQMQERIKGAETAFVETAKEKSKAEQEAAQQEYRAAYESGDAERLAKATQRLSRASAEAVQVEQFRPREPEALPDPPVRTVVPDERAVEWVRKNQWFQMKNGVPQNEETAIAIGIHNNLSRVHGADFPDRDPDAYYKELDRRIRAAMPEKYPDENQERSDQRSATTVTKQPATIVASASRAPAGGGPRKVQLTQAQVDMAKRMNIPLEDYAREVLALESK